MDAWVPVVAAAVGAGIAFFGQFLSSRRDRRVRAGQLLLDQCAELIARNEDFRNRLWEERTLGLTGRVDGWDLGGNRLASARIRLLCADQAVLAALEQLNAAGKALGAYWRRGDTDVAELEQRYEEQKAAIESFTVAASRMIRARVETPLTT